MITGVHRLISLLPEGYLAMGLRVTVQINEWGRENKKLE